MKKLAVLSLFALAPGLADARLTQRCDVGYNESEVYIEASPSALERVRAAVQAPAASPALYEALWGPAGFYDSGKFVVLRYQRPQDANEIAESLNSLKPFGVDRAGANSREVCSLPPPPTRVTVTEYHNSQLNHYFLSSSAGENAIIDSGGAGPGWSRTGETFSTIQAAPCYGVKPVYRFYTYGANTHFFTVEALECGQLRRTDPGWIFEGEAFAATSPVGGACPADATTLYRLYNNRWMFNDSNHRFVKSIALRDQMVARGWAYEGVAMCLPTF